jgi:hemerythrin
MNAIAKVEPEIMELVERARPIFAGQDPAVIGAALADLTARWLAGHVLADDPAATDQLRGDLMLEQVRLVRRLTVINARDLGT